MSSFGIGGTNAHVVLEEAPPRAAGEGEGEGGEGGGVGRGWELVVVSAKTEAALGRARAALGERLAGGDIGLADAAYTLQVGRRAMGHRLAAVCRDAESAAAALLSSEPGRAVAVGVAAGERPVVFMFPGQGTQYVGMGRELYHSEPVFRQYVDRCAELLTAHTGCDLREVLYPAAEKTSEAAELLQQTRLTQPALFVVEYALAQLWMSWGVRPQALVGHSVGEYVAACVAGVLSLEDALRLIAVRGRLMQELPRGTMLAVPLAEEELEPHLRGAVSLAAVNAPRRCVVSGETAAVEALERRLGEQNVDFRRLHTSHAFHSPMMEPMLAPFGKLLGEISLKAPQIPYLSNLAGGWITEREATDPDYWLRHTRHAVRFGESIGLLAKEGGRVLLEVGPGDTLSMLARQNLNGAGNSFETVSSLPPAREQRSDVETLLQAVGKLWVSGATIDWAAFRAGERRRRVPLPTYPFERKRHWVEPVAQSAAEAAVAEAGLSTELGEAKTMASGVAEAQERATVEANGGLRREEILSELKGLIGDLVGHDAKEVDARATFFDMGCDSLLLMRVSQAVESKFGVQIAFRQMFEEFATPEAVAAHIDTTLPPEAPSPAAEASAAATPAAPLGAHAQSATPPLPAPEQAVGDLTAADAPGSTLEQIIARQLGLMERQLEILRGAQAPAPAAARTEALPSPPAPPAAATPHTSASASQPKTPAPDGAGHKHGAGTSDGTKAENFGPWRPVKKGEAGERLTPAQQAHLRDLIARHNGRTPESKRLAQAHRSILSDNRASVGFNQLWKDLIYPIVVERSAGSRLWDVDGNEYVDMVMGFGVNLFGHSPEFVREALARQLAQGIQIGPQSHQVFEAAQLVCELTGMERANFCNTGSEAVMGALRLARTVTGRHRIALFAGSYHGITDGVLARGQAVDGRRRSLPVALGIPPRMVEDVLVLDYGREESLEILKSQMHELAAVLVEPVQSSRPDVQPVEFLRELRRLTEEGGTALIFDEMICGFRVHPGGAQGLFGIRADLATYGKVVGGGLPVGVIAGEAKYLDAIDGGFWSYGDDSYPRANQTFLAGTFCKHPLAMAGAVAALRHLKESGPELQRGLSRRTSEFAAQLNDCFARQRVPAQVKHFGSLLRLAPAPEFKFVNLLYYHLLDRGVHIWEGRNCFLSTAHTAEDIRHVLRAFEEGIEELRAGDFLPESSEARPAPRGQHATAAGDAARALPLTEGQKGLWAVARLGDDACRAFNESLTFRLSGPLNPGALRRAVQQVVDRHESLRATFSPEGDSQLIRPALALDVPLFDLTPEPEAERESKLEELLRDEARQVFDLAHGPLLRFVLVKLEDELHYLALTIHHLITDGWSIGVLQRELWTIYAAECAGARAALPPPEQISGYVEKVCGRDGADASQAEGWWAEQFKGEVPVLRLPTDRPRPPVQTFNGARLRLVIDPALRSSLKSAGAKQGCTLFVTLLAGFQALLHQLTGQDDVVVGIHSAGQLSQGGKDTMGFCINMLPLRQQVGNETSFADYLAAVKRKVYDAQKYQAYPFGNLVKKLKLVRDPSRPPLVSAIFNHDRATGSGSAPEVAGLSITRVPNKTIFARFDLLWNVAETDTQLALDCTYNSDLFDARTVRRWMKSYERLLQLFAENPGVKLDSLSEVIADLERQEQLASKKELDDARSKKFKGVKRKAVAVLS